MIASGLSMRREGWNQETRRLESIDEKVGINRRMESNKQDRTDDTSRETVHSACLAKASGLSKIVGLDAANVEPIEYTRGSFDSDGAVDTDSMDCVGTGGCLLYTSPSPRDLSTSRMPSSA